MPDTKEFRTPQEDDNFILDHLQMLSYNSFHILSSMRQPKDAYALFQSFEKDEMEMIRGRVKPIGSWLLVF